MRVAAGGRRGDLSGCSYRCILAVKEDCCVCSGNKKGPSLPEVKKMLRWFQNCVSGDVSKLLFLGKLELVQDLMERRGGKDLSNSCAALCPLCLG